MMTAAQCKAARALLDLRQHELASLCDVGLSTVGNFESGFSTPNPASMARMLRYLESQGLTFIHRGVVFTADFHRNMPAIREAS